DLLTIHYSLLTTHYSLLTTHYSPLTTHHSHSTKNRKSSVYTNHRTCHKLRSITEQPHQRAFQFIRVAKSLKRGLPDHVFSSFGITTFFFSEQAPVLFSEEETRS